MSRRRPPSTRMTRSGTQSNSTTAVTIDDCHAFCSTHKCFQLIDELAPSLRRGVRQRFGLRHWDWRARLDLKLHARRGRQALAAPSCLVIGAYCVVTLFFWG